MSDKNALDPKLLATIRFVAIANLVYFFIEFYFSRSAGSVSLLADSIDFLEDASINFLILLGSSWSVQSKRNLSKFLAAVLLIPSLAALWMIVEGLLHQQIPQPNEMTLVGFGALLVNGACALSLARYRHHGEGIVKAAVLSARNDMLANLGIIIAGIVTLFYPSFIPDIVVGIAVFILNVAAAKEVWESVSDQVKT